MNLEATCTQAQFGELVGISQPAVSDLLQRDVIAPGAPVRAWLLDYCAHQREQSAGRGSDGKLADARTEVATQQKIKLERQNKIASGEYVHVSVVEILLATVGRSIAGVLEPLHVSLHKRCPALTPDDLKLIQIEVAKACDLAVTVSLANLDANDATDTTEAVEAAEAEAEEIIFEEEGGA